MNRTPSRHMFVTSHQAVAVVAMDAVAGRRREARVTKRTPIWAGGLSTAGGKLPE